MSDNLNEPMETIEVDISDETFLYLAKLAHEKDITFNQLVTQILKEKLEEEDREETLPNYPSSSSLLPSTQRTLDSATQD